MASFMASRSSCSCTSSALGRLLGTFPSGTGGRRGRDAGGGVGGPGGAIFGCFLVEAVVEIVVGPRGVYGRDVVVNVVVMKKKVRGRVAGLSFLCKSRK